jgi:hypothetical protein
MYCLDETARLYYNGSSWEILYTHKVDFSPSINDGDFVGEFDTLTVAENSYGAMAPLYFDVSGELRQCDPSSRDTMPCSVMALENGTGDLKVLWRGKAKSTKWNFNPGGKVYVGISGELSQTRPSGAGTLVQALGVARASGEVVFNPSYVMVENA